MPEDDTKLFVGGLSWATTEEKMKNYFSQFGTVTETKVMKDKVTEHSRGFGFVTFSDASGVAAVLKSRPHVLDDKTIDPKHCTPMEVQKKKKEEEKMHVRTHKIFIGGLPRDISEAEVRKYFVKFGEVSEVTFALSKDDNLNKGFGFVTFSEESSAAMAVNQHYHEISGKRVEAKKAEPRDTNRVPKQQSQQQQPYQQNDQQQWNNYGAGVQNQNNPNQGYGQMSGWGQGYGAMGPSGGYMPNNNYGYGQMYSGYGSYGYGQQYPQQGAPVQGGYPNMGTYNQYNSSYGPMYGGDASKAAAPAAAAATTGKDSSNGDKSTGYHPYKR